VPTWRVRTEGAPTVRKAYGGNQPTNAGSYAPPVVVNSTQLSGGCERSYGAPNRFVPIDEQRGRGAIYLPTEQQGTLWAPPLAHNGMIVTLTTPERSAPGSDRPIHIPPVMPTPNALASNVSMHASGAQPKLPKARVTPTPQPRLVFPSYGG